MPDLHAPVPPQRALTAEGRLCIAILEKLTFEELRELFEWTQPTRSDDQYLAAFERWRNWRRGRV